MPDLFDANGETTVAIDLDPTEIARTDPAILVGRNIGRLVKACRTIGARPIAGTDPVVLSEREMRRSQPDAVIARPGRVWIAVRARRDHGESSVEVRDLTID